jgi:amidase
MSVDFRKALARLVPVFMPDLLFRLGADGLPVYKEVAEAILPTPFVSGGMPSLASPTVAAGAVATAMPPRIFGSGTMKPIDYCVALAEGRIAPPRNLDIHTVQEQELATTFRFHIQQYLMRRASDWADLGFTETLTDFAALNARSKFWGDDQRAAFLNWDALVRHAQPAGRAAGRERTDHAARTAAPHRHDGDLRNRLDALCAPAFALGAGQDRPCQPAARRHAQHHAGILLRPQRGADRDPDPRGVRRYGP